MSQNEHKDSRETKIFISYSRKNKVFARKLYEAMDASGIHAWVDWEGIPLSADWMAEIKAAIEGADAFLFIISPDSLKSKVCMEELELSIKNKKKLVPILFGEPEKGMKLHPKLASTNWVYMRPKKDDFNATVPKLIEAIQTDLGWVQQHTRLLQRATEWNQKKRNRSYLLQGADLEDAEQWMLQANSETGRDVMPLQAEYIHASRKGAVQRQRNVMIGVGIALVVSILLGITALWYANVAQKNQREAEAQQLIAMMNEQKAIKSEQVAQANKLKAEENEKKAVEQELKAKAQRSASEARIYQEQAGELGTSTLLAVDAYTRLPGLIDAEDVLRSNIGLLPLPLNYANIGARILKIQLSPDRARFVSSDESGQACVWNMSDGSQAFCVHQDGAVNDSVFSNDGTLLATGSNGVINIWDADNGAQKKSFKVDGSVWDLSVQPNGDWLGAGTSAGIFVVDLKGLYVATSFVMPAAVNKIDFSPSGKYLAMGMADGNVSVWDIPVGRTLAGPKHNGAVIHVTFSPDGKWVVSTGADSTARVMKIGDGRQKYSIVHGDWVEYAAFSPDSSWFATASDDGLVRVLDTLTGQERLRMKHANFVGRVRVSHDGQWLVSTGHDHTARIWDAVNGTEIMQIPVKDIGSAVDFNADATRLVVGDRAGNVTVWDTSFLRSRIGVSKFPEYLHEVWFSPDGQWAFVNSDDKKVWKIPADQLGTENDGRDAFLTVKGLTYNLAVSKDSKWVAALEYDGNVVEYNRIVLTSLDGVNQFFLTHDSAALYAVAFTPDSKRILTADGSGLIYIWDVQTGERLDSLQAGGVILSMAVSPDGKYLVAGLEEGNQNVVWDLTTLKQIKTLDEVGATRAVAFSPDGKWLATAGSESTVQLWNVGDGAFEHTNNTFYTVGGLYALTFSPTSGLLAAGDANGYVYLFDTTRMDEVARLRHINKITGLSFAPDGKHLAVASLKSVNVWDVSAIQYVYKDKLVEAACARLIENLDSVKWKTIFGEEEYRLICPNLPAGKN